MEIFTDRDMRDQVAASLADMVSDYDVSAIVDELQAEHGTVRISEIEDQAYWTVIGRHAK